jgi:hypothetical protein
MAKCRSTFVMVLIFAWTAIPALACLPNATMTRAEMACCKDMAGDCHMGVGQHPCCETQVEQPTPVATLDRTATQIRPFVVVALLGATILLPPILECVGSTELLDLSSPAPPGQNSVLRI